MNLFSPLSNVFMVQFYSLKFSSIAQVRMWSIGFDCRKCEIFQLFLLFSSNARISQFRHTQILFETHASNWCQTCQLDNGIRLQSCRSRLFNSNTTNPLQLVKIFQFVLLLLLRSLPNSKPKPHLSFLQFWVRQIFPQMKKIIFGSKFRSC